jgi:16S rRNA (cytidine1402-2'-O)-methyltransferase
LDQGVPLRAVPGPTALAATLSVAGFAWERFVFLGFLPRKSGARRDLLSTWVDRPFAVVCYESPHRLLDSLADVDRLFGLRPLVVACELTKLYEEIRRGTAEELLANFEDSKPRGEYTVLIAPPAQTAQTR